RITKNGFDINDKRLNNGTILEIQKVNKIGTIKVRNPKSKVTYNLPRDFGNLAHAHCVTSHFSQGKTVDEVFIWQPSSTFLATDLNQFYVSASRGRDRVHIYTDDMEGLFNHASEVRDRLSALELVSPDKTTIEVIENKVREGMTKGNHNAVQPS